MERRFEAALMKPGPGATHGKLPLVLLVHGGPASNFSADYFWFNSSASGRQGYQDLMVNPRGSAGYGESFLKANRADWGGGPNRLGIGGWSYGGEMTQWAIMQTDRFRAAVTGGRVFDLAAEFGTEDSSAEMNGTSARPSSTRGSLRATHPPPTFVMQKHLRSSCTVRTIAIIPSASRGSCIALANIMA